MKKSAFIIYSLAISYLAIWTPSWSEVTYRFAQFPKIMQFLWTTWKDVWIKPSKPSECQIRTIVNFRALIGWEEKKKVAQPKIQLFVKQHQTENGIFYPKNVELCRNRSVTEDFSRSVNLERVSIKNNLFLTQFLPSKITQA